MPFYFTNLESRSGTNLAFKSNISFQFGMEFYSFGKAYTKRVFSGFLSLYQTIIQMATVQ